MARFIAIRRPGPSWHPGTQMRDQPGWGPHATFMDRLSREGAIVLGGPLDDGRVLLVMEAASRDAVRVLLAEDPWAHGGVLILDEVAAWTVLLERR